MEVTGGVLLLVVAVVARIVDVRRKQQRKALQRRLATDMAALVAKRQAA